MMGHACWVLMTIVVASSVSLPSYAREACLQADLADPTSLPAALVGINAVVDCATARPEESTSKVDWQGKVSLIQCAQVSFHQ